MLFKTVQVALQRSHTRASLASPIMPSASSSIRSGSLRFKSDARGIEKSKHMHKEMESVLGSKNRSQTGSSGSPSSTSSSSGKPLSQLRPNRNTSRTQQAVINAGISFFTVLLAAQVLKSGQENRKLALRVEVLEEILSEKRTLLKSLTDEDTLRPLAVTCVQQVQQSQDRSQRKWWGSEKPQQGYEARLEQEVLETLKSGLSNRIGRAALTETEKDKTDLQELQPEDPTEQLLTQVVGDKAIVQELEELETDNGATVVKKRVFSM